MAERLILIRHGDLGEDFRGRYIGRTDPPLSDEGRRQAETLIEPLSRLPREAALRVSPLRRTRETAEIAFGGDAGFAFDPDLREIDFGRWEGMRFAEILAAEPTAVDRWAVLDEDFTFPDGEGIADFRRRVGAAAGRIIAEPAGTVAVVAHGGVIRFLICRLLGIRDREHLLFEIGTASVSEIRIADGRGVLTLLNERCHLEAGRYG